MACWQHGKLIPCQSEKCQVADIEVWQNVKLMKCLVGKMLNWQSGKKKVYKTVEKMACWQNRKLTTCQLEKC
jgi:hypothetical protein